MHLPRRERTPAGPHPLLIPCVDSGSSALAVDTSGVTAVFDRCTHHRAQPRTQQKLAMSAIEYLPLPGPARNSRPSSPASSTCTWGALCTLRVGD